MRNFRIPMCSRSCALVQHSHLRLPGCALDRGMLCSLDILLELREVNGQLEGHLCGKETFFSVQTIERMAKHFQVPSMELNVLKL